MVIKFTPWYGIDATCYHCGACYGDDGIQTPGRADVDQARDEWIRLDAGEAGAS